MTEGTATNPVLPSCCRFNRGVYPALHVLGDRRVGVEAWVVARDHVGHRASVYGVVRERIRTLGTGAPIQAVEVVDVDTEQTLIFALPCLLDLVLHPRSVVGLAAYEHDHAAAPLHVFVDPVLNRCIAASLHLLPVVLGHRLV